MLDLSDKIFYVINEKILFIINIYNWLLVLVFEAGVTATV